MNGRSDSGWEQDQGTIDLASLVERGRRLHAQAICDALVRLFTLRRAVASKTERQLAHDNCGRCAADHI